MKLAQWQVVLRELRSAGARGVHTFELRRMFIGNPSQRIAELEARGYVVSRARERLNGDAIGCRYTLVSEPGAQPAERAAPHGSAGSLFTSPPRLAIFDEDMEAA